LTAQTTLLYALNEILLSRYLHCTDFDVLLIATETGVDYFSGQSMCVGSL